MKTQPEDQKNTMSDKDIKELTDNLAKYEPTIFTNKTAQNRRKRKIGMSLRQAKKDAQHRTRDTMFVWHVIRIMKGSYETVSEHYIKNKPKTESFYNTTEYLKKLEEKLSATERRLFSLKIK